MSLVKCPECGREKVSSTAVACPECGFNIKEYYNKNPERLYQIDNSISYINYFELEDVSIFSNGVENEVSGKEIVKYKHRPNAHDEYDYYVSNGSMYVVRGAGTPQYIIWKDYLLNTNGKISGHVPDDKFFEVSGVKKTSDSTFEFKKNGSFTKTDKYGTSNGTYRRDGEFFAYRYNRDTPSYGGIIYNNEIYTSGYIKQGSEGRLKQLFQELDNLFPNAQPVVYSTTPIKEPTQNLPTCPNCGSTNVKHISGLERGTSIMGLGIFSRKINKTYKCLNCKYMW